MRRLRAVLGLEEGLQRFDARHQAHKIVLGAKAEHGIDQIVTRALLLKRDFEAVGEEVEQVNGSLNNDVNGYLCVGGSMIGVWVK